MIPPKLLKVFQYALIIFSGLGILGTAFGDSYNSPSLVKFLARLFVFIGSIWWYKNTKK